jgi:hypothetical protein
MLILTHEDAEILVGKSGKLFTRLKEKDQYYAGYIVGSVQHKKECFFKIPSLINITRIKEKK